MMKKISIICIASLLVLFASCTQDNPNLRLEPAGKKTVEPTATVIATADPIDSADPNATPSAITKNLDGSTTAEATYWGRADSNFIEVNIVGRGFEVYQLSDEVKEKFDSLGINEQDKIIFTYEKIDSMRRITSVEKVQ